MQRGKYKLPKMVTALKEHGRWSDKESVWDEGKPKWSEKVSLRR